MTATVATARQRHAELIARRVKLQDLLAGVENRRRPHAIAAGGGDAKAEAALAKIDAEELKTQGDLRNVNLAIADAAEVLKQAEAAERAKVVALNAAASSKAIDELLALDDSIDDAIDGVRALIFKREKFIRDHRLPVQATAGTHLFSSAIEHYFGDWLRTTNATYETVERFAQMDGHVFRRQSPGTLRRPPRPMTAVERALLKHTGPSTFSSAVPGYSNDADAEAMLRQSGAKRFRTGR